MPNEPKNETGEPQLIVNKTKMLEWLMLKLGPGGTLHLAHLVNELQDV